MSETKRHDSLCIGAGTAPDFHHKGVCDCLRVERIRADERAKALVRHLAKMEEFDEALDAARAEVRERIAQEVWAHLAVAGIHVKVKVGYDAGRAGAFADVLALLGEEVSE